ncbi:MAG: hypothetical protein Q9160_006559 [Pyrenula sp. 1 TL-2023]
MPNPTINLAYTVPVNPPSSSLKLTVDHLWRALEYKCRYAQEIVPAIESVSILPEPAPTPEFLKRRVNFTPQPNHVGMPKHVFEDVTFFKGTRIEYRQSTGTLINNIISTGGPGTDEVYLTSSFEWVFPADVEVGSPEFVRWMELHQRMAKVSVDGTVRVARSMAENKEVDGVEAQGERGEVRG